MEENNYWTKSPLGSFQLLDREQAATAALGLIAFVMIFHPYL